ncbi:Por secretion system C-terminal sorting domain-containing protein [Soonwooa buanensis]|uniref:Por secretion system C-terminal sorting domain-containing protein n=1 Tax=Soonwooa buanensis TaxID=619805 RepID=A0A1T5DFD0_9FLAO|nr:T9SS type A sorting domain-containing protein [Soonwooa buanensis]SKB70414.1 Por secretion system C-terminal sorting domain-containing protein [Soonwooa buanensis]
MKKTLLTLGVLVSVGQMQAQQALNDITVIGDGAYVKVGEGALMYSKDLSLRTVDSGVLDIYGNVMLVGDFSNYFQTSLGDGTDSTSKRSGGNVILRMNAEDNSRYGQIYIEGLNQGNITGMIDKEYRDRMHGTYQQIAMPFFFKYTGDLYTELSPTHPFNNVRWSKSEILTWNNEKARSDDFFNEYSDQFGKQYLMLGTGPTPGAYFNASKNPILNISNPNTANTTVPSYTEGVYVLRGTPIGGDVYETNTANLYGAGLGINYGTSGQVRNIYGETYNSYLQDYFVSGNTNDWTAANFGKNLYQFGNPYFTNLDLGNIGVKEAAAIGDEMNIPNVQGIRFDPGNVVSDSDGATYSTTAKTTTYASGVPTGDVNVMIKPMGTFVVKLGNSVANNPAYTLDFKNLRRFAYTPRAATTNYDVSAAKGASASTVKQLGVIALDANGNEMGRTYYVVYPNAITGRPSNQVSTQVKAGGLDIIGTYEEDPVYGGADSTVSDKYWLYINEAGEDKYAGKPIPMELYSSDIKSLKFEIRENVKTLDENQSTLSTGKEFYIQKKGSSDYVTISQGAILPVSGDQYNLFYDKAGSTLDTDNAKLSRTRIAFDPSINNYILLFDPKWNQADVKVYDISGKLIISKSKVSTKENLALGITNLNGTYVVTATSEKGEVFNGKVVR